MHNARFRLTTAIAGATMCVFAVTATGQTTPTTTGTTNGSAGTVNGTTAAPTTTNTYNGTTATPAGTDQSTTAQPGTVTGTTGTTATGTTTTTDNTVTPVDNTATDTGTSRGFPWGLLGLLGLIGLFKGRSTEVRRDVYTTTTPRTTTVGTGTAYDDRTATPRAASGVGTTGTNTGPSGNGGTMGDPGSRR